MADWLWGDSDSDGNVSTYHTTSTSTPNQPNTHNINIINNEVGNT